MARVFTLVLALSLLGFAPLFAQERHDPAFTVTSGAYLGLTAWDTTQSVRAFSSGTGREGNPFMTAASRSPVVFASIQAAAASVEVYGLTRLRRTHPKLAWGMLAGVTTLRAGIVLHNARVMRK